MTRRLWINKLTLIGIRKNYEVLFKRGLNFISGPMSTGKSTIVEMINYALGSEKHKNYIEVRENCSDVQLEFNIGEDRFKVIRPLFDFERPIKLFRWDKIEKDFNEHFELLHVDSPKNEDTLSAFLLQELGFYNVKVANQSFSFRDLFKYCYIKQGDIDSENLLSEKTWGPNIKRKPTFELIFNLFDTLLSDLKAEMKVKIDELSDLEKRRKGVFEFLKSLDLLDYELYVNQKKRLDELINEKKSQLYGIKSRAKIDPTLSRDLEGKIFEFREQLEIIDKEIYEQKEYINKLVLLRNQYKSEMEKIEFVLEGAFTLSRYKFDYCPACLNEVHQHVLNGCELCGSELKNLTKEETAVYKSDLRKLNNKLNKISIFISEQQEKIELLNRLKDSKKLDYQQIQEELIHISKEYVNPFIEQIETLNYEIGEINNKINELSKNLTIINQYHLLTSRSSRQEDAIERLKNRIKEIEANTNDKESIVNELSEIFSDILQEFSFPKLSNAYINLKDYLPYVRDRKYDDLGSLGAVTMLTMAYFTSILILGIGSNNNHPGILLIDSPRKNLGSDIKDDQEFKDEKIFNSIIKSFIEIHGKYQNELQLIIINNGYPEFLQENLLVKEFDGNGTRGLPYGLIDDLN
ncbi:hypothetical protein HZF08_16270 [Paenibacillus sp. CGMCC 1.16610]|uniref:Nuclease SbcCD subunit C n=1 Tax=Paenibacillus anseongense TaxID=2682845 RepID=A0ABW9UH68_9BACL|nr:MULTISPECIES: hypothetical protein [Paenibacillus]MBA2939869.1 hypothetical protein [Paenibacillus sp. CGMCC 1.16610]MVQ39529.1 hypothetical protein [Paenibacillus anseongense]